MHALRQHHHHAPSRLRRTHSLLSHQLPTTSLRLLSRLCIISRQAFLATSFTLLSRSTAARCSSFQHPALHLTTDAMSCNTKSTFPPAPAFGLPKIKNGGGDTWGSWIEQRHTQSNLHYRDTFFSSSPVQLLLGILPQLGVLATDCLTWQRWIIRTMIFSVGHRNCRTDHRRCRLLLAHWRAGRSSELNGRGGRHLDYYSAVLRVSFFGVFLLSLVVITDTHSCNFLRVLETKNGD